MATPATHRSSNSSRSSAPFVGVCDLGASGAAGRRGPAAIHSCCCGCPGADRDRRTSNSSPPSSAVRYRPSLQVDGSCSSANVAAERHEFEWLAVNLPVTSLSNQCKDLRRGSRHAGVRTWVPATQLVRSFFRDPNVRYITAWTVHLLTFALVAPCRAAFWPIDRLWKNSKLSRRSFGNHWDDRSRLADWSALHPRGRPCGRPPPAAVLGRHRQDGTSWAVAALLNNCPKEARTSQMLLITSFL